ncbi:unnamed protein product [Rhizoctonia solani]|uniref:Uncharacterized protein n=1 Tax=Rhizoctonia solani TaxID=456999 RepID=A0A8H3CWM3_9AGAM|nr:unnamed protein product [Rhizoctonia solani]CAE6497529.1 unnamed protein product [Rhizoctonia solani]
MRFTTVVAMFAALSTLAMGAAIDERAVCGSEYPPAQCSVKGTQACCDLCCKWVKNGVPAYQNQGYEELCGCN